MSDGQVALDIGSDYLFRVSAIRTAEAQLPHNRNVFVYQFAWKASKPELGALHAVELPFVFGNVGSGQSLFLVFANLIDAQYLGQYGRTSDAVNRREPSFRGAGALDVLREVRPTGGTGSS
jgi:hypothetical protein